MRRRVVRSFGRVLLAAAALAAPAVAGLAGPARAADAPPAPAPAAAAAAPTTTAPDVTALPRVVDEGVLLEALEQLLQKAQEPTRVALAIDDVDATRRLSLERTLVRVMRERGREEVLTPALVKARLGDAAAATARGDAAAAARFSTGLAADHVLTGVVVDAGGQGTLTLSLVSTEQGAVLGAAQLMLEGAGAQTSARAQDATAATADLVEVLAEAIEARGVDVHLHRVAVAPVLATGAAKEARVDRLLQAALTEALVDRGFLVVERAQLQAAMDQLALQELTGTERVAELGQLVGAQSLVLASVADAADAFIVTARIASVEGGAVLGAASAAMKRAGVVSLAAVETRTPGEAAISSALVPGWGQTINGQNTKAVLFGTTTYASLLATIGLGVGGAMSWSAYNQLRPGADLTVEEIPGKAEALRVQTNALLTTTAVAGGFTAALWSLGVADAFLSSPVDR